MKSRKVLHAVTSLIVFVVMSLLTIALTRPSVAQSETTAGDGCEHTHCCDQHESRQAEAGDGHAHKHSESHGRLGLEALSRIACEHHSSIVECDECRYEVGVARIDPALSQALVEAARVTVREQTGRSLRLTGQVDLDLTRIVEITSPGSGRIEQVRKVLGDVVRAGDTLLIVRSSDLSQAQADLRIASAQLDLARQTHEREKQLHDRRVGSQADYQSAVNQLAVSEATFAAAQERLRLLGSHDGQAETGPADGDPAFGELAVRAPMAGTIVTQNAVRGRLVGANDALCRIVDLSQVWIWCDVYEADLAAVYDLLASNDDAAVEIAARAFPGIAFDGVVDMMGSQVNPDTRTVKVRVRVDNPGDRLKPGMFVTVSLVLGGANAALTVPETAVLSDADRHFVFVKLSDELWIRRDVSIGPAAAGVVEVRHGLDETDVIAARGAFMFKSEVLKGKMGAGCAD